MGVDIAPGQALAPGLADFVGRARRAHVPVIPLKMAILPELRSPALAEHYRRSGLERPLDPSLSEFFEVVPQPGDMVIPKYRDSGFVSTYLERYLRPNS